VLEYCAKSELHPASAGLGMLKARQKCSAGASDGRVDQGTCPPDSFHLSPFTFHRLPLFAPLREFFSSDEREPIPAVQFASIRGWSLREILSLK
jgi:hypothetical protein